MSWRSVRSSTRSCGPRASSCCWAPCRSGCTSWRDSCVLGDRPAIAGTVLIGWALFVGLLSDAPIVLDSHRQRPLGQRVVVGGGARDVGTRPASLAAWPGRPRAGVSRSVRCERRHRCAPSHLRHHVRATRGARPTSVRIRRQPGLLRRDDGRCGRLLHPRRTSTVDRRTHAPWALRRCRARRLPGDAVRITCCARLVRPAHRRRHRDRPLGSFTAPDSGGRVRRARCDTAAARRRRQRRVVGGRPAHRRVESGREHGSGRTAGERSSIGRSPATASAASARRRERFFSPEFVRREATDDLIQAWYDPHNIVVQITVSLGIVGLGLFAWFVVSAVRRSHGPAVVGGGRDRDLLDARATLARDVRARGTASRREPARPRSGHRGVDGSGQDAPDDGGFRVCGRCAPVGLGDRERSHAEGGVRVWRHRRRATRRRVESAGCDGVCRPCRPQCFEPTDYSDEIAADVLRLVRARDRTRARPALHVGATRYSSTAVRRCRRRACARWSMRSSCSRTIRSRSSCCAASQNVQGDDDLLALVKAGSRRSRPPVPNDGPSRRRQMTPRSIGIVMFDAFRRRSLASVRRLARLLLIVGIPAAVFGLSKYHAQFIGDYDFTESFRFAWAIAYCGILLVVCYGLGLPDLPRSIAFRIPDVGSSRPASPRWPSPACSSSSVTRCSRVSSCSDRRCWSCRWQRCAWGCRRSATRHRRIAIVSSSSVTAISCANWRLSSGCGRSGRR